MFLGIIVVLLIVAVSCLVYIKIAHANPKDKHELAKSIDQEVNKYTRNASRVSLMVGVYKNGAIYTKAYTNEKMSSDSTLDANSVFQLGSISKVITASILQVMVNENIVDLDSTLESTVGDVFELSDAAKRITLRQLAMHTSGLPRVPKSLLDKVTRSAGKKHILVNPYSYIELGDVTEYLKATKGLKKAGKFQYSNYGMGLLGHVLEVITGSELEVLAKEKIFDKLDMDSTGISINQAVHSRLVQGHTAKGHETDLWTFGALGGAGAFYSTMDDMMKFVRANIEKSDSLSTTLQSMHNANRIGWMEAGYVEKFFGNKMLLWHNGMVGGYSSYIAVDKPGKTGVVVLSNNATDVTMLGSMIALQARTQSWATDTQTD